jgi:hypothetical protein
LKNSKKENSKLEVDNKKLKEDYNKSVLGCKYKDTEVDRLKVIVKTKTTENKKLQN